MDPKLYKDVKTSRGINYHYFSSPPRDGKPTILLVHGFPSTSLDWFNQVPFFQKEGYGVVAPDLLGYGGTDRPTTPETYKLKQMSADLIDILDAEKVAKCIVIGHDWGAGLTSRLYYYHADRFEAFGFLAVPYNPPTPKFDHDELCALTEMMYGYATYGYFEFFGADDAADVIAQHPESFFCIGYPADPKIWVTDFCPVGALRKWLTEDKKCETAKWLTAEEGAKYVEQLKEGLAGPTCWYKCTLRGFNDEDEKQIPESEYLCKKPVFFGACTHDYICVAAGTKTLTQHLCPNSTIVEFDSDHWVQLAVPDKLNAELLKWIKGLETKASL